MKQKEKKEKGKVDKKSTGKGKNPFEKMPDKKKC